MAGNASPGWRRHWYQIQSRFWEGLRLGAQTCAGPVPTPVRRPRRRQGHSSDGAAERKFAYIAFQNHAQAQSGTKHTPKPQNRSVPPTTGRPWASPSRSLRSTSAWALFSPQRQSVSKTGKEYSALIPPDQFQCDFDDRPSTPRQQCSHLQQSSPKLIKAGTLFAVLGPRPHRL